MSALFDQALERLAARDLAAGRGLLRAAAEAGDVDAALSEIALTANGSGAPPDWAGAVALLQAAAGRHGGAAAQDLELLEAMALDCEGNPRRLPEAQQLDDDPAVRLWRGFLTPPECAHVALSVGDILGPSQVADPATGRLVEHPIRTSSAAQIGPTRESLPIQAILRRIAAATGTHVAQGESLTVLHYVPGQQYRMHMDALPATANQRIGTLLIYLNEGYIGGETTFGASGLTVAGRGGDALWFNNVTSEGAPDPRTRHAGLPVLQGVKWLATRWIRARPFDVWQGPEAA
jgi:prolyl 4-hydroxylase